MEQLRQFMGKSFISADPITSIITITCPMRCLIHQVLLLRVFRVQHPPFWVAPNNFSWKYSKSHVFVFILDETNVATRQIGSTKQFRLQS